MSKHDLISMEPEQEPIGEIETSSLKKKQTGKQGAAII
jgi:hypothetical protein